MEKILLQYCKSVLGVWKSTKNSAVYIETGQAPFGVKFKLYVVKYWVKILKSDGSITKCMYLYLKDMANNPASKNLFNWAYEVKTIVQDRGFNPITAGPSISHVKCRHPCRPRS